jgi:hypothetical protein
MLPIHRFVGRVFSLSLGRSLGLTLGLSLGLPAAMGAGPAAQDGVPPLPSVPATPQGTVLNEGPRQVPATEVPRVGIASVLGIEVRSGSDRNIGRIVDLLADPDGSVAAAVVEFGGFLGVGTRKIAIAWRDLRLEPEGGKFVAVLDIPRDRLRGAPEYKPGAPVIVTGLAPPPPAVEPVHAPPQPSSHGKRPHSLRKHHPPHATALPSRLVRRPAARVGGAAGSADRRDR